MMLYRHLIFCTLFLLEICVPIGLFSLQPHNIAEQALEYYQQGELAKTPVERKKDFDEALKTYLSLAKNDSNGKLFYNIGNCYYQLGEYPWAILYYEKAWRKMPRESIVKQNLSLAEDRAGVAVSLKDSIFQKILFFHYKISIAERLEVFSWIVIIAFFLASWNLWKPNRQIKKIAIAAFGASLIVLMSVAITQYFSGVYGIFIEASPLYRDAGKHYAFVVEEPLFAGTKVQIVDVVKEGQWIKVLTPDGIMGYVSQENLRII